MNASWRDDAACRGFPTSWWFPEKSGYLATTEAAKAVCARCPVRAECLEYGKALHGQERTGIWGGISVESAVRKERSAKRWAS